MLIHDGVTAKPKSIAFLFSGVMFLNPLAHTWVILTKADYFCDSLPSWGPTTTCLWYVCINFCMALGIIFGQLHPKSFYPPSRSLLWEGTPCSTGNAQVTMQPRIFSMMGAVSAFEPTLTGKVAASKVFRAVLTIHGSPTSNHFLGVNGHSLLLNI